jgi:outer membrane murein-binding lipoprotein Lpp
MSAQELDSLPLSQIEKDIQELKQSSSNTARIIQGISSSVSNLNSRVGDLEVNVEKNASDIESVSSELGVKIEHTDAFTKEQTKAIRDNTDNVSRKVSRTLLWGIIVIILILCLLTWLFLFLRKKLTAGDQTIARIMDVQHSLQEESIKLDNQLIDILEKQDRVRESSQETESDHKLAISIANEVVRIEQNLVHMDSSVKGVSNLKNRAESIKTTLSSRGYEIPTLLGTPYHEGYNMIATMELDEDLEPGTQIIRRVTKPQINYRGRMIQAAQVVVAFNE